MSAGTALVKIDESAHSATLAADPAQQFVTVRANGQLFGFPVLEVRDVLRPRTVTPIPLAPSVVAGALNLRGRVVTAIDLRLRLGYSPQEHPERCMSIVTEQGENLYSFLVDEVGDVVVPPANCFEKNPANLDASWKDLSAGVFQLPETLLVILDIPGLLDF